MRHVVAVARLGAVTRSSADILSAGHQVFEVEEQERRALHDARRDFLTC